MLPCEQQGPFTSAEAAGKAAFFVKIQSNSSKMDPLMV